MGKKLIPEGKWSRITLLWSFSQFVIISIIECFIIYRNINNKKYYSEKLNDEKDKDAKNFTALIVYQVLFIVALAYQLYLTVDTLLKFSTIDLIALSVFNSMCLLYSITQYTQAKSIIKNLNEKIELNDTLKNEKLYDTTIYEYINIGIMIVFTIGWWYITFRLYKVFGWNVFKQIGADISLKKRLKLFNILVTLLKLTVFFIDFLFMVQYFTLVLNYSDLKDLETMELIHDLAIPVIVIIGTIFGFVAVSTENRLFLGIYIFTLCAVIGFMCSTFADIYLGDTDKYVNARISLTVTITCTVILCLITYGVSLINFKNFGLGIPKSINKTNIQQGQSESNQQKRLSID